MGITRRYCRYLLKQRRTKNALVMAIHDERLAAAAAALPYSPPLREGPGEGGAAVSPQATGSIENFTSPHPPLTPPSREGNQGIRRKPRLLDVGCGTKPYLAMFADVVSQHVGLDVADTRYDAASVDLVGTADSIPAADESFGLVLSTSNLEHVPDPAAAVAEWCRVLEAGGTAIVTVPMCWHLHDAPHDYFRFTKFGLVQLFTAAGFEIERVETLGGFWTTAATMNSYYFFKFNRGPLRWFGVIHLLSAFIQTVGLLLEKLDPAPKWACMVLLVATKPVGSGAADG